MKEDSLNSIQNINLLSSLDIINDILTKDSLHDPIEALKSINQDLLIVKALLSCCSECE